MDLKQTRKLLKLTQFELAKELGVSKVLISAVERGHRNLSEGLANKIEQYLKQHANEMPEWTFFQKGQNFSIIIEALKLKGVNFTELRTTEFKVRTIELSKMYIGFLLIPSSIKTILSGKYNVNLEYIENGKAVPMFHNQQASKLETPYYKSYSLTEALSKIEVNDQSGSEPIGIKVKDIDAYIDLQGDNIPTGLKGKTILGLINKKISIDAYGRLFLIKLESGDAFLRRIYPSANKNEIIIRKEDTNFIDIHLPINEIHSTYMLAMALLTEYI